MSASRVQAVQALLVEHSLEALLVTDSANCRYLSGFSGSAGIVLLSETERMLITDGRYTTQALQQCPDWNIVTREQSETLLACIGRIWASFKQVGFEPNSLSHADYVTLNSQLRDGQTLHPVADVVEQVRAIKDDAELATLRRAVAITDQALAVVLPILTAERTEREVAWMLHQALVEHGATGPAFDIIVAAGPNSALPHARPTDQQLGTGRPIIIDMGALVDGYHGDMTRTFIIGEPDQQWHTIYNLVLEALQITTQAINPGTTGQQADAFARDVITNAGYGEAFSHGLGHGVGLEIHERPRLNATNMQPLPVGAVFSIEPGIYIPGWGGVRLENLVYLNQYTIETLTSSPLDTPVVS